MSTDEPLARPRRRWPRITIGRAMLAVSVAAPILLLVVGIDPFRGDPMRRAIDEATAWCRAPTASFDTGRPLRWPPNPVPPGTPPTVAEPCVLKVVRVGDVVWDRRIVEVFGTDLALAADGRLQEWRRAPTGSGPHRRSSLPPDAMAALAPILPTLPPSTPEIPPGVTIETHLFSPNQAQRMTESRAIAFGFADGKAWVTRVYDRKDLPPAAARLLGLLGFDPSLP